MKKVIMNDPSEVIISAVNLENANLSEWERLELHLLDQAAVVIPGKMTVMNVIREPPRRCKIWRLIFWPL